ncbi:MAG: Uncharacterised protein [Cryomorphaceae bacterium]|nr:MAG: Uncharacterised protein [Cryomorphaceae bacterium]
MGNLHINSFFLEPIINFPLYYFWKKLVRTQLTINPLKIYFHPQATF